MVVALLVIWVEPDHKPVLHLPKQQGPTAWIITLRYQCPLKEPKIFICFIIMILTYSSLIQATFNRPKKVTLGVEVPKFLSLLSEIGF